MTRKPWTAARRAKFMATVAARKGGPIPAKPVKLKKDGTPRKVNDCGPKIKAPSAPKQSCRRCAGFQLDRKSELTGEITGTCHTHPPKHEMGRGVFPPVHGDDWCLEWRS